MGKKIQCIGRYAMDGVTLGKGNFAHVELATHGVVNIKVAVKIIDTKKIKDDYQRANLNREARIMAILRHPNIIRLYETLKATTLYCLVTEYARGGELLAYIKSQKDQRLPESSARPFLRQLVSAIHYIHERGIVHRDLKMENIMLDEKQKNIKLIDFGLSNIYKVEDPLKTRCGSPEYAAPELFVVGKTYGPEIDIWSIGIVMYAMVVGRLPFFSPFKDEYHRQRMLQHIQRGLSQFHEREMQVLTPDCRCLVHQLIEPNPELRIPLIEIETHPWTTKSGKFPFVPYTTPQRNRVLRNQVINELALMMDMKKTAVCSTVKEHKADELSAMFNLKMDQLKQQQGWFDIDHTVGWPIETTAQSRSAERDKSRTPEPAAGGTRQSSKSSSATCSRQISTGTTKLTANRKSGIGTKAPVSSSRCSSGTSEYHSSTSRQQSDKDTSTGGVTTQDPDTAFDVDDLDDLDALHATLPVVKQPSDSPQLISDVVASSDPSTANATAASRSLLHPADVTSPTRPIAVVSPQSTAIGSGQAAAAAASREGRENVVRQRLSRTLDLSVTQPTVAASGGGHGTSQRSTTGVGNGAKRATTLSLTDNVGKERRKSPVAVAVAVREMQSPRLRQPAADCVSVTPTVAYPVPVLSAKIPSAVTSVANTSASDVIVQSLTSTPSKVVVTENHVDRSPSMVTNASAAHQSVPPATPRARRPSSLPYSLRPVSIGTRRSAVRTALPVEDATKPKQPPQHPQPPQQPPQQPSQPSPPPPQTEVSSRTGQPSRVVAPTATPEDSFVDGPSSSGQCTTDAFTVAAGSTNADTDATATTQADATGAARVSVTGRVQHDAARPNSLNTVEPTVSYLADHPPACLFASVSSSNSLSSAGRCRQVLTAVHGLSRVSDNASSTVLQNGKTTSSGALTSGSSSSSSLSGVSRLQRVLSDARSRLFGQRGVAKRHERKTRKKTSSTVVNLSDRDINTLASSTDEQVHDVVDYHRKGEYTAPALTAAEERQSAVSGTPSETIVAGGGRQSVEQPIDTSLTKASNGIGNGCSIGNGGFVVSGSVAVSTKVGLRCGLSPASPSYDRRHARFSHIGSHALDVFFSPEDSDEADSDLDSCNELARIGSSNEVAATVTGSGTSLRSVIWRPLATTCSSIALMTSNSPSGSLVDVCDDLDSCLDATASGCSASSTTASSSFHSAVPNNVDRRWNGTAVKMASASLRTNGDNGVDGLAYGVELWNSCHHDDIATTTTTTGSHSSTSLNHRSTTADKPETAFGDYPVNGLMASLSRGHRTTLHSLLPRSAAVGHGSMPVDRALDGATERLAESPGVLRLSKSFAVETSVAAIKSHVGANNNTVGSHCTGHVMLPSNGSVRPRDQRNDHHAKLDCLRPTSNNFQKKDVMMDDNDPCLLRVAPRTNDVRYTDGVDGSTVTSHFGHIANDFNSSNHMTSRHRAVNIERKKVQWSEAEQQTTAAGSVQTNGDARRSCSSYDCHRNVPAVSHCSTSMSDQHHDRQNQASNHVVSNS